MTSTWSLLESDFRTVESILLELLKRTQALAVHLVERSGQVVVSFGDEIDYDLPTFGSLAAADLAANDELIQLFGGARVDGVACLGSYRSMASTLVADRLVLCVIFDRRSTLGLVRHRMHRATARLTPIFQYLFERVREIEPAVEEPAVEEPAAQESAEEELAAEEPSAEEPSAEEPAPPARFREEAAAALDELLGDDAR